MNQPPRVVVRSIRDWWKWLGVVGRVSLKFSLPRNKHSSGCLIGRLARVASVHGHPFVRAAHRSFGRGGGKIGAGQWHRCVRAL